MFYLFVGLNQEGSGWNNVIQNLGGSSSDFALPVPAKCHTSNACFPALILRATMPQCCKILEVWLLNLTHPIPICQYRWYLRIWSAMKCAYVKINSTFCSFLRFLERYGYLIKEPFVPGRVEELVSRSTGIPSGKHTKNYGKWPFFMGKLTINGHVQ